MKFFSELARARMMEMEKEKVSYLVHAKKH